jgi:hypothetical protein
MSLIIEPERQKTKGSASRKRGRGVRGLPAARVAYQTLTYQRGHNMNRNDDMIPEIATKAFYKSLILARSDLELSGAYWRSCGAAELTRAALIRMAAEIMDAQ